MCIQSHNKLRHRNTTSRDSVRVLATMFYRVRDNPLHHSMKCFSLASQFLYLPSHKIVLWLVLYTPDLCKSSCCFISSTCKHFFFRKLRENRLSSLHEKLFENMRELETLYDKFISFNFWWKFMFLCENLWKICFWLKTKITANSPFYFCLTKTLHYCAS